MAPGGLKGMEMNTNTNAAPTAAVTAPDEREAFEKYMAGSKREAFRPLDMAIARMEQRFIKMAADNDSFSAQSARRDMDTIRAALAATPATHAAAPVVLPEPAEFQKRTTPEWDAKAPWSDWEKCTPGSAADCERVPVLHNWRHEVRKLYTEQQVRALLAQATAAPAAVAGPVVLCWVPEDELPQSMTSEAYNALFPHSRVDLTRQFPVFGPATPVVLTEPAAQGDALNAARWRWLSEHIRVSWNEGKFTSLVRIVSDEHRNTLNAIVDQMMAGDWSDAEAARAAKGVE